MFWFERDRFIHKYFLELLKGHSESRVHTVKNYMNGITCQGNVIKNGYG